MDILKAEIERKKRQLQDHSLIDEKKKCFRRGDLITKWELEYHQKQDSKHKDTRADESKNNEDATQRERKESESEEYILPRKEVVKRLRERSEPILLFGETMYEAFKRLRRLEILEPEINKGLRNDFQEALEKVDQAYLNEILKSQGGAESEGSGKSVHDVSVTYDETTMEDILKMAKGLGVGDLGTDAKVVLAFLKLLLQMWGHKLNEREESEKIGMRGKLDSATYAQTQAYIKPLFRKLKTKSLPEDIMESLVEIVNYMLAREYVKANDAYLQMAIGNAPWPIGVTMVGIHARTGREKIFSKHVAHVLNDETQRKYIQALKRLMTKCQQFFPTDPSKSVEYNA